MLRGTGRRPGWKTTRSATLALLLLVLALAGTGSAIAATSGGAGLTAPTPSAKAPALPPLVPALIPVSGIPQLSAGLAVRKVSRRGASEAAIGYASRAHAALRVRIDVVRRSDGLSIFDVVRTVQPDTQHTYLWSGRAQHGVVAGDGGYEIRVSLGDGPTARPISAAGSGGSLDGATMPAGGASPSLTPAAPTPAVSAPQGSPPPPGAATVGAFSFVGAIFPARGRHDYGDEANSFGAGRAGHIHQGQDVLAKCGTPLVAAVGGVVRTRARQANAGNYVVIDDPITKQSYVYAHLRQPAFVRHGMRVTAGEPIGVVGQTGDATTCHLHFELWTAPGWYAGGEPIDPLPTLKQWDHAR
jgi:murein DD-endopeptidase MepM/ murein hydrolase activator NlpD